MSSVFPRGFNFSDEPPDSVPFRPGERGYFISFYDNGHLVGRREVSPERFRELLEENEHDRQR